MMYTGLINQYRKYMPLVESTEAITLNEGNTPLIHAKNLESIMPGIEIYLKYDGLNPTGSFKDRGMTMAVTKAVEDGSNAIMCASTGNISALAAYSATIIPIEGNFDDEISSIEPLKVVNSDYDNLKLFIGGILND